MRGALVFLLVIAGCDAEPKLKLGITAEEHAAYFPIQQGVHALNATAQNSQTITCDTCHKGQDAFAVPVCLSCHSLDTVPLARAHAGVAAFLPKDTSCYECHPDGNKGAEVGVDTHSQLFFPINAGDPHGQNDVEYNTRIPARRDNCTACHQSVDDRTVNLCAECHAADTAPTLLEAHPPPLDRSFVDDSVSCKECHAETPIDPVVHPLEGHNNIFTPDHHESLCKDCHDSFREAPQQWAIDFTASSCTSCHTHTADCNIANQSACLQLP